MEELPRCRLRGRITDGAGQCWSETSQSHDGWNLKAGSNTRTRFKSLAPHRLKFWQEMREGEPAERTHGYTMAAIGLERNMKHTSAVQKLLRKHNTKLGAFHASPEQLYCEVF